MSAFLFGARHRLRMLRRSSFNAYFCERNTAIILILGDGQTEA